MNKFLIILFAVLVVGCISLSLNFQHVRTPELFGDATMITISPLEAGFIVNGSYVFIFKEKADGIFIEGRMLQVLGGRIDNAGQPISYLKHYNSSTAKFTGWIDFRGHERAFCGYSGQRDFPFPCRWQD